MNYFKILFILLLFLLLNNQAIAYPQWTTIKNEKQDILLDERGIQEKNNSLYYAVFYNKKIIIVESKGNIAGVVKTISENTSSYQGCFTSSYGNASEYRELKPDSLLYNANNRAMELSGYNGNIDLGQADFTEYLSALEKNIKKYWKEVREWEQFSEVANVKTGEVILSLKIATNGRLISYSVNNLSDNNKLAEIVTKTKEHMQYFVNGYNYYGIYITGALPYKYKGNSVDINVKFSYGTDQVIAEVVTPNAHVKADKTNAQNNTEINYYMSDLKKRIKRNWQPPHSTGVQRVVVIFKISKTGQLLECKIKKSSYNKLVDDSAINAIKKTNFRALPSSWKENNAEIEFTFDKN